MKVEFQCITAHGKIWKDANIEKIKERVTCPQCGLSYDDPKPYPFINDNLIMHHQPGHFYLVKIYTPIEFSKETDTEVEFGCYSCDAMWLVKVTEKICSSQKEENNDRRKKSPQELHTRTR